MTSAGDWIRRLLGRSRGANGSDSEAPQVDTRPLVIYIVSGPGFPARLEFPIVPGGRVLIGAHPSSDVILPDVTTPTRAALILMEDDGFYVQDLGPGIGCTFIFGKRAVKSREGPFSYDEGAPLRVARAELRVGRKGAATFGSLETSDGLGAGTGSRSGMDALRDRVWTRTDDSPPTSVLGHPGTIGAGSVPFKSHHAENHGGSTALPIPPPTSCLPGNAVDGASSMGNVVPFASRVDGRAERRPRERVWGTLLPEPENAPIPTGDDDNDRALDLASEGRVDEALNVLDDALSLDPEHLEATYNRALLSLRCQGTGGHRAVAAIQCFDELVRAETHGWRAAYLHGLFEMERGDWKSARADLDRAAAAAGDDAAACARIGEARTVLDDRRTDDVGADGRPGIGPSGAGVTQMWQAPLQRTEHDETRYQRRAISFRMVVAARYCLTKEDLDGVLRNLRPAQGSYGCHREIRNLLRRVARGSRHGQPQRAVVVADAFFGGPLGLSLKLHPWGRFAVRLDPPVPEDVVRHGKWATGRPEASVYCTAGPTREQRDGGGLGFSGWVHDAAFALARDVVAIAGYEPATGHVVAICELPLLGGTERGRVAQRISHGGSVARVAISPDARVVVSADSRGVIRAWEVCTGRPLAAADGGSPATLLEVSPDGRYVLFAGADGTLVALDLALHSRRPLFPARQLLGVTQDLQTLLVSPDGRSVRGRRFPEGSEIFSIPAGGASAAVLFPDESMVVTAHATGEIQIWSKSSAACWKALSVPFTPVAVALDPAAFHLCAASPEGQTRTWFLDRELDARAVDWDEAARGFLRVFLACHTRIAPDGLTRTGRPEWSAADIDELLSNLQDRGWGHVRREGILRELAGMAEAWEVPPLSA